jgi:hypothetical protein
MRRLARLFTAVLIGVALGTPFATDHALHISERVLPRPEAATAIARETGSTWEHAQVAAQDGVQLDGWLFMPREPNGSVVLLLHGLGDTRAGMLGAPGGALPLRQSPGRCLDWKMYAK